MRAEPSKPRKAQRGVSLIELLVVVFVTLITAAIASPNIMRAVYDIRMRSSAGDLAGLMQQARICAAKDNQPYPVRFTTLGGARIAYIELNRDGTYVSTEPQVQFSGTVVPAAGAPSGTGGAPSAYVHTGDSSSGSVHTNTTTLGFSSRGLPCAFDSSTAPRDLRDSSHILFRLLPDGYADGHAGLGGRNCDQGRTDEGCYVGRYIMALKMKSARSRQQRGMSLIELMIAIAVLTIGVTGCAIVIPIAIGRNFANRQQGNSTAIAQMVLEKLMSVRGSESGALAIPYCTVM